jgi:DNA-binding NtrC family response regulator
MQRVYELIAKAAATEANVLIQGETGVGKELVARTIHQLSERRAKPFIAVNCGAVADTLLEREFFGHRKGAFTGADRDRKGLLASAHQGILFLDEIEELTSAGQATLLRAIETGEYTPVGDHASQRADVRVIAVTNRDLDKMLRQGHLRDDFFYRIHVLTITVPPLCERREDIFLLVEHFFEKYHSENWQPEMSGTFLERLSTYDWPGNVRELENLIRSYLTFGQIDLPTSVDSESRGADDFDLILKGMGLYDTLRHFEKHVIIRALNSNTGSKQATASMLGIDRRTLYHKMKKYGIT